MLYEGGMLTQNLPKLMDGKGSFSGDFLIDK
jgi:hypothetical protein